MITTDNNIDNKIMASPFFSGRIPQELYNRIDQYIKESGESKTQILINALSQYLGIEIPKPKSNGINADFLSELESLKERVTLLERSQTQQAIEPVKIAEIPHKQMSWLDQVSDNNDNSIIDTVIIESEITETGDDNTDNNIAVSVISNEQILTTRDVCELTGIDRKKLGTVRTKNTFPIQKGKYSIIGYAGKKKDSHKSDLWRVKTTDNE